MHFFAHLADFESMLLAPMEAVLRDAQRILEMEIDIDRLEDTVAEDALEPFAHTPATPVQHAVQLGSSQENSSHLEKGGQGGSNDGRQAVGYAGRTGQENRTVGYAGRTIQISGGTHSVPYMDYLNTAHSWLQPPLTPLFHKGGKPPKWADIPDDERQTVGYAARTSQENQTVGYSVRTIQIPGGTHSVPFMDTLVVNPPLAPVLIPLRTNQAKTSVMPSRISPLSQASSFEGKSVNTTTLPASGQFGEPLSPSETQATASRLTVAMEPSFEQAYQLTQTQLEKSHWGMQEQPSTSLVRNTFNVTVAMNGKQSPEDIDRTALEEALTDILRASARRHGLEV